jgi:hypothetical protein
MLILNELSWQEYATLPDIRNLSLNEQVRQYNIYINEILQSRLTYLQNQSVNPTSLGGGETPSTQAPSGDLTITFSDFATVDLFLTNGVENLADWNDRLVLTGNPYTSISVDEATYTIYLGGGSNVVLKDDAFNGYLENPTGLGLDLLSIQDNGTIVQVGAEAFIACLNLTTVELLGATIIGNDVFSYCMGLQYVYLPNVASVGTNAFFAAFNSATLPITLYLPLCTSLGNGALQGPINIDTANGLIATFPIVMQTNGSGGGVNDEIQQLTAYSDGAVIVYV